jgi:hypothetical protein
LRANSIYIDNNNNNNNNNSLLELSCSYKNTELTSTLQWIELSYKIVHEYALESRLFTRVKIIRHLPK